MAWSNVKSAEFRAAGGRRWNKVKSGQNFIRMEGPLPAYVLAQRNRNESQNDEYYLTKAALRATLAQGYDESMVQVIEEGKRTQKGRRNKRK